jgi:hypothetical protein
MSGQVRLQTKQKRTRKQEKIGMVKFPCSFCSRKFQGPSGQICQSLRNHIRVKHPHQSEDNFINPQKFIRNEKKYWGCRRTGEILEIPKIKIKNKKTWETRPHEKRQMKNRISKRKMSTGKIPPTIRLQSILTFMKQRSQQEQITGSPIKQHLGSLITQGLFDGGAKDVPASRCPYCRRSFVQFQHFREITIRIHCLEEHPKEMYTEKRYRVEKVLPNPLSVSSDPPIEAMGQMSLQSHSPPPEGPDLSVRLGSSDFSKIELDDQWTPWSTFLSKDRKVDNVSTNDQKELALF